MINHQRLSYSDLSLHTVLPDMVQLKRIISFIHFIHGDFPVCKIFFV